MAHSSRRNLYRVLGVRQDASEDEIKRAYHRLARVYHPDVNPDNPASESRLKEINEAHAVLSDADKRAEYDATLAPPRRRVARVDDAIRHDGKAVRVQVDIDLAAGGLSFGLGLADRFVGGLGRALAAAERAVERDRASATTPQDEQ